MIPSTGTSLYSILKMAEAMPEVACVAIFRHGKILMGRRRDNHLWTQPGGHLEKGESPIAGAVREVKEEAGIDIEPHTLKHLATEVVTKPDGKRIRVHAYRAVIHKAPTSIKEDPDAEVHRWHWLSLETLFSPKVWGELHVKPEENVVMKGLGFVSESKMASVMEDYAKLHERGRVDEAKSLLQNKRKEFIQEGAKHLEGVHETNSTRVPTSAVRHMGRGILGLGVPGALGGAMIGGGAANWRGAGKGALIGGAIGSALGAYATRNQAKKEQESIQRSQSILAMPRNERERSLREQAEAHYDEEAKWVGLGKKAALKSPKHPDSWYPKDQVAKGMIVEKEHSEDPRIRSTITKNHLDERRDYYNDALFDHDLKKEGSTMNNFWNGFEKRAAEDMGPAEVMGRRIGGVAGALPGAAIGTTMGTAAGMGLGAGTNSPILSLLGGVAGATLGGTIGALLGGIPGRAVGGAIGRQADIPVAAKKAPIEGGARA